jgi:hypothetical protein
MNSDDCYLASALNDTVKILLECNYDFIYGPVYCGSSMEENNFVEGRGIRDFKLKNLLKFFYSVDYIIPSQSVFFSKSLFTQVGFLDENLHLCMDLDFFARITFLNPLVYRNSNPICFYRIHDLAKTSRSNQSMTKESIEIARKYLHLLQRRDSKKIMRLILFSQHLEDYRDGKRSKKITSLLKTMIRLPLESLTDTRFLGLIKRSLFNNFNN